MVGPSSFVISPLRSSWQQLRFIAFFVGGLPLRECRAPAKIDGLATGGAKRESPDVERRGRLTVTEVGHDGGQISPRDDVEQFLLVDRKTRPDLPQVVDRVDVGNDGVMAGALESLVSGKLPLAPFLMIGGSGTAIALNDLPACRPATIFGTSGIKLSGEITHLGAGRGADLLALAVIEFLERLPASCWPGHNPGSARAAQFLERRQIVELWRPLPLVFNTHPQRAPEVPGRFDDRLGDLPPGRCQSNGGSSTYSATAISRAAILCRESAPLGQGNGASLFVDFAS